MYSVWFVSGRAEIWNVGHSPSSGRKLFESYSYETALGYRDGYNDALESVRPQYQANRVPTCAPCGGLGGHHVRSLWKSCRWCDGTGKSPYPSGSPFVGLPGK